jgi:hypothetical protein
LKPTTTFGSSLRDGGRSAAYHSRSTKKVARVWPIAPPVTTARKRMGVAGGLAFVGPRAEFDHEGARVETQVFEVGRV